MVVTGADRSDARTDGVSERWTTQLAGPLLLVAVTAGLLGQGAYYPSVQRPVGLLIAAATLLGLAGRPLTRDDLRLPPVVPALALAAWAVLDGALVGVAGAGVGPALLLVGVVAVLLVCRRLRQEDRELLLAGVIGIGLLVALTGWLGVAGRAGSWAFQAQGLWRASSTLTYPNATAAVLAAISLVVLGRLVATPGSVPLALAATGLLTGLAATMSRAGALALVVGLVVLAGLRGPGATARAAVGPVAGALVAMLGLLPSMPAASPPRPALALVGLGAGLTLAAMVTRVRRWSVLVLLGGVLVAAVAGLLASGGGVGGRPDGGPGPGQPGLPRPDRGAARSPAAGRPTSPDRHRTWTGRPAMEGTRPWQPAVRLRPQRVPPGHGRTRSGGPGPARDPAGRDHAPAVARAPHRPRTAPPGLGWSRRRPPSPSTAASTLSGTCQPSCSP